MRQPLRILTWHVHGSYLYYLSHVPHVFVVPYDAARSPGWGGRSPGWPWPANLVEAPREKVCDLEFDCILFQSHQNYTHDQFSLLTPAQRALPKVLLEHDPPRQHPTDTKHPVQDEDVLVVHVTAFNRLMWDCGGAPTCVVDHGVTVPRDVRWSGALERGIVVINNLAHRGRRLGADVFEEARARVPLDLVGMDAASCGGIGEVPHHALPAFMANYRFFFNPIRWTSLGLSILEAMAVGLPVVGLATTELVTVFDDGEAGYLDTDPERLVACMEKLLAEPETARRLGERARRIAAERFSIHRFVRDWLAVFDRVVAGASADIPVVHPRSLLSA